MALDTTGTRNDYVGTGLISEYEYTYRILSAAHLKVIVKNPVHVETVLELGIDYSVQGVGSKDGGTITLLTGALADDYTLTILRDVPLLQGTDIKNQREFYPEIHEIVFDRLTMMLQQLQEQISRSLRLPPSSNPAEIDMTLPTILGAKRTLIVSEDGLSFVLGPTPEELSDAGAAASTAVEAAAQAAISASDAQDAALAAAASAAAALLSEQNAYDSETMASAAAIDALAAILLHGAGVPDVGLGVNGQIYIDTVTGTFYEKQSGSWVEIFVATGGGNANVRAGVTSIAQGDSTVSITFSEDFDDTNYSVVATLETSDSDIQFLTFVVDSASKAVGGCTLKINAPVDSANYKVNWTATKVV